MSFGDMRPWPRRPPTLTTLDPADLEGQVIAITRWLCRAWCNGSGGSGIPCRRPMCRAGRAWISTDCGQRCMDQLPATVRRAPPQCVVASMARTVRGAGSRFSRDAAIMTRAKFQVTAWQSHRGRVRGRGCLSGRMGRGLHRDPRGPAARPVRTAATPTRGIHRDAEKGPTDDR